jgi:predicted Zn-dependent peptidase
MAKNYLHQKRFVPLSEVFNRIDQITADKIQEVANEIFSGSRFRLSYL